MLNIIFFLVLIYQDRATQSYRKHSFFQEKSVLFDPMMMAVKLKQLVKKYIAENNKSEIICLAEIAKHKILFTFLYYSDLQQIELAWAYVKGKVGRQYSIGITLQIVYARLITAFGSWTRIVRLC